jgi:PhnB protein
MECVPATKIEATEETAMAKQVAFKPESYNTVTSYLSIAGASEAIAFYKKIFGAEELMRFASPDGKVGHAEIKIGDTIVMLADEYPEIGHKSPKTLGGSPVGLMIYVPDVDATVAQAEKAGAKIVQPLENKFYGDRSATISDPFGHTWMVATHVEDVSPEEMERRAKAQAQG